MRDKRQRTMTELAKVEATTLLQRTRDLANMSEDELRRFASEAARDRDGAALWALTEAYLTLHGSSGSRVELVRSNGHQSLPHAARLTKC